MLEDTFLLELPHEGILLNKPINRHLCGMILTTLSGGRLAKFTCCGLGVMIAGLSIADLLLPELLLLPSPWSGTATVPDLMIPMSLVECICSRL
jgi:hypothetical protein